MVGVYVGLAMVGLLILVGVLVVFLVYRNGLDNLARAIAPVNTSPPPAPAPQAGLPTGQLPLNHDSFRRFMGANSISLRQVEDVFGPGQEGTFEDLEKAYQTGPPIPPSRKELDAMARTFYTRWVDRWMFWREGGNTLVAGLDAKDAVRTLGFIGDHGTNFGASWVMVGFLHANELRPAVPNPYRQAKP
jgi:hypothetical protein